MAPSKCPSKWLIKLLSHKKNYVPQFLKQRDINTVLRIRNKSFGSSFGSGSGLQLVLNPDPDSNPDPNPDLNPDPTPDLNPDSNPGFGSGSVSSIRIRIRNWPKLPLFVLKFLSSLIFKVSSVTWLRTNCAINFQSTRFSHIYGMHFACV